MNKEQMNKYVCEMADLVVRKMENLQTEWEKPWINTGEKRNFYPQNLSGRHYSGGNAFLLFLLCEKYGYDTPVFLTFRQAKEAGVNVRKGEKSLPVYYYMPLVFEKGTDRKIKYEEYKKLTPEEQKRYRTVPLACFYRVFNLGQTDFAEVRPERWAELKGRFEPKERPTSADYKNERLDAMLECGQWVCPVTQTETGKSAFYSPAQDRIEIPVKRRFTAGAEFYGTLLHEMAHSTGAENRLGRLKHAAFGSVEYGREELVAELSGALSGVMFGVSSAIQENNIAHLKAWIENIKEEPKFLLSVLGDTTKAVGYISDRLGVNAGEEELPQAA